MSAWPPSRAAPVNASLSPRARPRQSGPAARPNPSACTERGSPTVATPPASRPGRAGALSALSRLGACAAPNWALRGALRVALAASELPGDEAGGLGGPRSQRCTCTARHLWSPQQVPGWLMGAGMTPGPHSGTPAAAHSHASLLQATIDCELTLMAGHHTNCQCMYLRVDIERLVREKTAAKQAAGTRSQWRCVCR